MPNATLRQVNTKLFTLLQQISNTKIAIVYEGFEPNPSSYPYAYPIFKGGKEIEGDTQYDQAQMDFYIRVCAKDNNSVTTYTDWLDLIDTVYAQLRLKANRYLGGLVEDFLISPNCIPFKTSVGNTNVLGCDIVISVIILTDTTL